MSLQAPSAETVARALGEFPALRGPSVAPLTGGLINQSFAVTAEDGDYVLQRVHPVFAPEVHENIAVGAYQKFHDRDEAWEHARRIGEQVGMGAILEQPSADLTVAGRKRLELARALATPPGLARATLSSRSRPRAGRPTPSPSRKRPARMAQRSS